MRHLLRVQIGLDRRVGVGADGSEREENVVFLDQLAGHRHGLGRLIGVIVADHIDLAAVDAAFGVGLFQIRDDALGDHAIGGSRTGIGRGVANTDFVGARRRTLPESRPRDRGKNQRRCDAAPRRGEKPAEAIVDRGFKQWRHRPALIDQSPHLPAPLEQYICDVLRTETVASQPYSLRLCLNRIDFVSRPSVTQRRTRRMCVCAATIQHINKNSVAPTNSDTPHDCIYNFWSVPESSAQWQPQAHIARSSCFDVNRFAARGRDLIGLVARVVPQTQTARRSGPSLLQALLIASLVNL